MLLLVFFLLTFHVGLHIPDHIGNSSWRFILLFHIFIDNFLWLRWFLSDGFRLISHFLIRYVVDNSVYFLHGILMIHFFLYLKFVYLDPEKVSIVIGLKPQNVSVWFALNLLEHSIIIENNEVYFLYTFVSVDPAKVCLLLLVLNDNLHTW